jgi:hypothetical protein
MNYHDILLTSLALGLFTYTVVTLNLVRRNMRETRRKVNKIERKLIEQPNKEPEEEDDELPDLMDGDVVLPRTATYHSHRNIATLRLSLIGKLIDLQTAQDILNLVPGTSADHRFRHVLGNGRTREIWHVMNSKLDTHAFDGELLLFRHPVRDWYAVYTIVPFNYDISLGFNIVHESNLWDTYKLYPLLQERYRELVAVRTIKRSKYFQRWLNAPQTRDGKAGIVCRLGWKNALKD